MNFKCGDRVRILPFSEIDPMEAGGILRKNDCYCINRNVIDELAFARQYYTVEVVNGLSYKLREDKAGFWWDSSMIRPYEEDGSVLEEPDSGDVFISLFGMDVEVRERRAQ